MMRVAPKYQFCIFITLFKNPLTPLPFEHLVDKFRPLRGHFLERFTKKKSLFREFPYHDVKKNVAGSCALNFGASDLPHS